MSIIYSDEIRIEQIPAEGCHGLFPSEKERPQLFIFDLGLTLSLEKAGQNDDFQSTVDYGAVEKSVIEFTAKNSFDLIETLCIRQLKMLFKQFPLIQAIKICCHKPMAPLIKSSSTPSVTLIRNRQWFNEQ